MRLIGMLDSPYVRRVAISLEVLEIPFEHSAVSVFDHFGEFQNINPVVKAPTLVFDDGDVMMDSSLTLQYLDRTCSTKETLWSSSPEVLQNEFRIVSLALAACDKCVQILYERNLRPKEAQYEPWMERVTGQRIAALTGLEQEIQNGEYLHDGTLNQTVISTTVSWTFIQSLLANLVPSSDYPSLAELSERIEKLPVFIKYPPVGSGVNA